MMNPLEEFIEANDLLDGDRLPPERELAEKLKLTRSALRSLLGEMEARGKLTRQVGRGTFIGYRTNLKRSGNGVTHSTFPAEIFEVRLILEPAISGLAAQRITFHQMDELAEALDRSAPPVDFREFEFWDAKFHQRIVSSSRNTLLITTYEQIATLRGGELWGKLKENSLTLERMKIYHGQHQQIFDLIKSRNSEGAIKAMHDHIVSAKTATLGS